MNNKELTELYHEQFNRIKELETDNAALKMELAAALDVSIARGEQLGYDDRDYEERIKSLLPTEEQEDESHE